MKKRLPTKYIATLPRVSAIVEYFYPFTGNARERFEDWLLGNDIGVDEYMKEASTGGTFVHSKLEDYMNGKVYRGQKYINLIKNGINFIKDYSVNKIYIEHYIRSEQFQGTIDLVCEIEGQEWIIDWKSWSLAKDKFGLKNEYKKPYDKLKKARLQLSLYAYATGIENIGVVELRNENYYFYKLEIIPKEQIDKLLNDYKYHYIDEL